MEFEAMWRENKLTGTPKSVLSDTLSKAIVTLQEELSNSSLWDKAELRNRILRAAFPKLLVDKLSLETLLQRVPDAYIRAIFGSYLASRFVYRFGIAPSQFKMYEFISEWE
ncbi:NAD+ dependent glutamate dehydrogenase [Protomyces lactucae-debilis]|uniref:NAD+ dependent glutamate dehydrogenase n=1 Tax=Protomyces lactucae-debilis TaxID=2754530 RepID=A0A1Y2EU75_PROLT|nr:NAD+ dependent glutamate dehydrogenase [Protomyces lactucae-debilis]ORY75131.1 NAD+ dependent glutamate dehydrogenase [Protomyces lactucae-debilis]